MLRSPWKAEGRRGYPSFPTPLSMLSDMVTSKDSPGESLHNRVPEICAWKEIQNQMILIYY